MCGYQQYFCEVHFSLCSSRVRRVPSPSTKRRPSSVEFHELALWEISMCGYQQYFCEVHFSLCSSRFRSVPSPLKEEALNSMSLVGDICLWMGGPTFFARSCSSSDLSAFLIRATRSWLSIPVGNSGSSPLSCNTCSARSIAAENEIGVTRMGQSREPWKHSNSHLLGALQLMLAICGQLRRDGMKPLSTHRMRPPWHASS